MRFFSLLRAVRPFCFQDQYSKKSGRKQVGSPDPGDPTGCRKRGQTVCGEVLLKEYWLGEKARSAFSFHDFAANYPRFHSVAYFSIAPS
jgi:hypothetical protein